MTGIAARASAVAERHPHGTRVRYIGAGCRCDDCRRANTEYEKARALARKAGDWNGIVPADKARAHLRKLSRQGVGRRAVRAATDISDTILQTIRSGARIYIRARTERLILRVTGACASDHATVPAGQTWKLIEDLLEEGYTKERICQERGVKVAHIQLRRTRVLVKTADQVARIHRKLTA